MQNNFPVEFLERIKNYCDNISLMLVKDYPKIRTFVVQLNKNNLFIGANIKGCFLPKYYSKENPSTNIILNEYLANESRIIYEIYDYIINNSNLKIKSYNIFYDIKNKKINICKNMIGNKSISASRLFEEII